MITPICIAAAVYAGYRLWNHHRNKSAIQKYLDEDARILAEFADTSADADWEKSFVPNALQELREAYVNGVRETLARYSKTENGRKRLEDLCSRL